MQNKNKTQLQKDLLKMHERMAAAFIAVGMVAGSVAVSQEIRRAVTEFAVHPVFAVVEHSIKESEIAHRAMRLDSTLPADAIGGE